MEASPGDDTLFDVELIARLVDLMVEKDLREIDLRDGESKISLKRGPSGDVVQTVTAPPGPMPVASPSGANKAGAAPGETDADEGLVPITSPMVGTFYTASDPESPPYVNVGGTVDPDSVVCIIEAMKVFNEIKAEVSGTVERILVRNEQPVEFGQPLFMVRPS